MYLDAWRKHQTHEPLSALERLIAEVIGLHPEYHALLGQDDDALDRDFLPELGEGNPFMHMGMHIALREQLATDRPPGVVAQHRALLRRCQDAHTVEHQMMECLGQALWEAQRAGTLPDESAYLACLKKLAG